MIGYLTRPLDMSFRCLFAVAGILLLVPASAFPFALWSDPIGLVLAVAIVGREWLFARRTQTASSAE